MFATPGRWPSCHSAWPRTSSTRTSSLVTTWAASSTLAQRNGNFAEADECLRRAVASTRDTAPVSPLLDAQPRWAPHAGIAALLGLVLGIAAGSVPLFGAPLSPLLTVLSMIPPLAILPILFIVFDLEIAFLFPWAVALKGLGAFGFWSMMAFLGVLTVGFVYEWCKGALDWE